MSLSKVELDTLRQQARKLVMMQRHACLDLGRVFYTVSIETAVVARQEVPIYTAWGFPDVYEWCEHELGVHKGTAKKFMKAYTFFGVFLQFNSELLEGLSVTKLVALTRVIDEHSNKRDIRAWLDIARTLSCCQLDNKVDEALYGSSSSKAYWGVCLPQRQKNHLQKALSTVISEVEGVHTMGDALDTIVQEWMAMRGNVRRINKKLNAA